MGLVGDTKGGPGALYAVFVLFYTGCCAKNDGLIDSERV